MNASVFGLFSLSAQSEQCPPQARRSCRNHSSLFLVLLFHWNLVPSSAELTHSHIHFVVVFKYLHFLHFSAPQVIFSPSSERVSCFHQPRLFGILTLTFSEPFQMLGFQPAGWRYRGYFALRHHSQKMQNAVAAFQKFLRKEQVPHFLSRRY